MRLAATILPVALAAAGGVAAQSMAVNAAYVRNCMASALPGQLHPACLGAAANACQSQPGGQTTLGISECIQAEAAVWDGILNEQYGALMGQVKAAGQGLPDALRAAQRAWIAFRDAQCAYAYQVSGGGSIRVIDAANCLMVMTARRTIELRDMRGGQ
jgi:uncharacterized protein YecT (DUF1311 family)